jgi:hydroxymethylbilane synthase
MVRRAYLERYPDDTVEVVTIKTEGDLDAERPLDAFGGSGAFVREIERALIDGRVDAAVHSAKDLAVDDTEGLEVVAFLERADAHDVLIRRERKDWERPGAGFRIATDSSRRRAQLADAWPGVEFVNIRGNIETRLDKLAAGTADALVLAAAGLRRLELHPEGEEPISIPVCVPAPGQGAVAVQAREGDAAGENLRWLNHIATSLAVQAERDMAAALGAGCSVPLGAHVEFRAAETRLVVAFHDGQRLYRAEARSPAIAALEAVQLAIADLRDQGATWGASR